MSDWRISVISGVLGLFVFVAVMATSWQYRRNGRSGSDRIFFAALFVGALVTAASTFYLAAAR